MVNIKTITECLDGLIGFSGTKTYESMMPSGSGIYIHQLHPLFNQTNFMNVVEAFEISDLQEWAAGTYTKGQIVKHTTGTNPSQVVKMYISTQDGNTGVPGVGTLWEETTRAKYFFKQLCEGAAMKVFNSMIAEKKLGEAGKTVLKDVMLYEGVGNITNRVTKMGRFVGFRIALKNADITALLNKIGLQIDQAQTLNVYLYHSSSNTPIHTFTLNHTKNIQFQWHNADFDISFLTEDTNAGGVWYLGYYEDDLTGQAIKKDISWSGNYECASCTRANASLYKTWSKYFSIESFYVNHAGPDLWDEEDEHTVMDMTWGMNLQVSVRCDLTRVFCQNKDVLADVYSKQVKVDLLTQMAYSMRDNQQRERMAGLAMVALQDPEVKGIGAVYELKDSIKAVNFDFSNLNTLCMPCNQRNPKMSNVWR